MLIPSCVLCGQVTCPLCPVKTASALTMTLLQALGLGAPTSILLTGIRKYAVVSLLTCVENIYQKDDNS